MARHRRKLPLPSEAKEVEGNVETPAQTQHSRWLTGMGSAPTVFHKPDKGGEVDGMTVTPDTGIQQRVLAVTFGDNPYEKAMDNYVTNVWNFVENPQILYNEDGYYVFRFQNIEDRDLILQAGPYTYHNKPFVLQQWRMDFKFDPGSVSVIPLWIKFPGLPLGFWSTEALSKLASVVGKPLYTDRITAEMERVSYARVLVETDISQPLPDCFEMQTQRGVIVQQIEYEWKPNSVVIALGLGIIQMNVGSRRSRKRKWNSKLSQRKSGTGNSSIKGT
ncbi:hypothetical protein A4A49_01859 [Nicotiana attenuata]|uniref:DUF4283 domain-containing protein n=1 Tax=Nicotiana attenuata TaxID=49451 RepID=A0A1J6IBF1_NICAT|nr:hypothetical protein A4A49_01859 [Nicotiana attenuata]